MTIIPLNNDYNGDLINDLVIVNGNTVDIIAGVPKGDPLGGEVLFSGTLDELAKNAEFSGAAAIIENASNPKPAAAPAATPAPAQKTGGSSSTLRQDKGLDGGSIYGGN